MYNMPPGCSFASDFDYHDARRSGARFLTCPGCEGEGTMVTLHEHTGSCGEYCPIPEGSPTMAICPLCCGAGNVDREDPQFDFED